MLPVESPSSLHRTLIGAVFAQLPKTDRVGPSSGHCENRIIDPQRLLSDWATALVWLKEQHALTTGDRVALLSENRREWIIVDLAVQAAGCVLVPLAVPLSGVQLAEQLVHCGAKLVFVSTRELLAKLAGVADRLPKGIRIVVLDCAGDDHDDHDAGDAAGRLRANGIDVGSWADVCVVARMPLEERIARLTAAVDCIQPNDLATILYTSGTTGEPKGVMLNQHNLLSNTLAKIEHHGLGGDDTRLCVLPLSHIFGRTCDLYVSLVTGSKLALSQSRETFFEDCAMVRPTYINAVPYFFDKCYRVLRQRSQLDTPGALRELLGGGVRTTLCGGAALPGHVHELFERQGVLLLEGYGLTEASPVVTDCTKEARKPGSVGRALPGIEIRTAEDGEILTRGPHVMQGYWQNTTETSDAVEDGWLHTGDLGRIDGDGFVWITGRKKEMIVTAGGRNIPPVPLEALLTHSELIDQAMVVGEGRNYLGALIVPNGAALASSLGSVSETWDCDSTGLVVRDTRVHRLIRSDILRALAERGKHEQIGRFAILTRPFSLERGELTAKQSLRRDRILEHYAGVIEDLYSWGDRDEETGVPMRKLGKL